MKYVYFAIVILSLSWVANANDEIPGAPRKNPLALQNATVHPVSSQAIKNATILIDQGKIQAIGPDVPIPKSAEVIDIKSKHVYPGLIDAATILGLVEINSIRATIDYSEVGSLNPNVRSWVAFNPDSEIIPVTRSNGVLLSLVMPQGGLISGRSAVMQLDGWTWESMALKTDVGLHIEWPRLPRARTESSKSSESNPEERSSVDELRKYFDKARDYHRAQQASENSLPIDARLESMRPVLEGDVPLFIRADELASIQSAVAFATEEKLRMVLIGGYDAPYCATLLRQQKIPVIVTGTYRLPQRDDDGYDDAYTLPERLRASKVTYCLASQGRFGATGVRNLPFHAATAIAYGLPEEEAIRAVTIYAAKILGVSDRVGSLEVGKDATLIVTSGNPLEVTTDVEQAYIQGRTVDLGNRQKRLYHKYQSKYEQGGIEAQPE